MLVIVAWAVALTASLPAVVLAIECALGLFPRRPRASCAAAPPYIVLMPAHDEAWGIAPVIAAILAELRPCDRLVVVAHNCTDATAAVARGLGAMVVERDDPSRRGKGHALEFGRDFIADAPSLRSARVVTVVDADCIPATGALATIAAAAFERRAVVQGAYLMAPPHEADAMVRVSCFAFLVKNLVRQAGLHRLAGMALLQGSGMAFPRSVFAERRWATGSLVEDLDMGLDLLLSGQSVVFAQDARFISGASSRHGTRGQRRRWEHGMLHTAFRHVPKLLAAATRRKRGGLVMMALDLLIPPTVLLLVALALATLLVALTDGIGGLLVTVASAQALLATALFAAWRREARSILPPASLWQVPAYVLWKIPLLLQFVTRRERAWVRTERDR
ncbi:MAG: hypothetical protein K0R64_1762 [Novosphingobium lindaniclasticum]|jgi:cellulose synthase/poly-beta-1,6-N-acetylglucosamine synthase-like glycosyltransferase|uniref:glycosyltransferase family 2 protein n=1 Tax=Novosphingobium lindaniclasticum TaxID=1329895 RepID=UPI0024097BC8|nr:glycosyltransferase family 2 protein [Novosphingobium lindaniclasticum]MDF2638778.1 hypothetical protein [Novosphingobium lindaniclasticum]